jgi:hypothetical protein
LSLPLYSAMGGEGERLPVGRPPQVPRLALVEEQALGVGAAGDRRPPGGAVLDVRERHRVAVGGHRGGVAGAEADDLAGREIDRVDLAVLLLGAGRRIRRQVVGGRPVLVVVAAAHEHEVLAVRREGEVGQLLAVVVGEARQLPRFEPRRRGGPDVAGAALVEHPRDLVSVFCRHHLGRKRIAEDLLHRERSRGRRRRGRRARQQHDAHEHACMSHCSAPPTIACSAWYTAAEGWGVAVSPFNQSQLGPFQDIRRAGEGWGPCIPFHPFCRDEPPASARGVKRDGTR